MRFKELFLLILKILSKIYKLILINLKDYEKIIQC